MSADLETSGRIARANEVPRSSLPDDFVGKILFLVDFVRVVSDDLLLIKPLVGYISRFEFFFQVVRLQIVVFLVV